MNARRRPARAPTRASAPGRPVAQTCRWELRTACREGSISTPVDCRNQDLTRFTGQFAKPYDLAPRGRTAHWCRSVSLLHDGPPLQASVHRRFAGRAMAPACRSLSPPLTSRSLQKKVVCLRMMSPLVTGAGGGRLSRRKGDLNVGGNACLRSFADDAAEFAPPFAQILRWWRSSKTVDRPSTKPV